jgi:hypothetical protein
MLLGLEDPWLSADEDLLDDACLLLIAHAVHLAHLVNCCSAWECKEYVEQHLSTWIPVPARPPLRFHDPLENDFVCMDELRVTRNQFYELVTKLGWLRRAS